MEGSMVMVNTVISMEINTKGGELMIKRMGTECIN